MVNNDFRSTVELINKSENILITSHTKPDGDACGCIAAMCDALEALGKKVKPLFLSPVPQWYEFLFTKYVPVLSEDIKTEELMEGRFGEFDLIVIVDTNSYTQLSDFEKYLKKSDASVLVIDHHVTSDGLGDVELIDSTAAATAMIVYGLFKYAGWNITEKIAEALFVAAATDTGWFQFSNTDSKTFRTCAELIDAGAKPTKNFHDLYHNFTEARFRLMLCMLNSIELDFDGRYASYQLTQEDFKQTGATYKDTENLIDECKRIASVEVIALFVEQADGGIRCSMRSTDSVNVCNIMLKYGGGGHNMAAASSHYESIEDVKRKIRSEVKKQLF
jgi:phosphoesterase RecJ-like protein